MPLSPPLAIFDLDGTLVDSNRDLVPALNQATALDGLPPISREEVGYVVGQGALRMIERAFEYHGRSIERGGPRHRELLAEFLKHYEAHIADHTVFFPGALKSLSALADQGWALAVCTNKYEHLARKLLQELGEAGRFKVITGGDTFATKKPDPAHLTGTIELAGCDVENTLMVGDSINDIDAAKAANIPVIAVDFGYTEFPVEQLGPDRIISSFDELVPAARNLIPASSG